MRIQKNKILNFVRLLLGGLIILSAAGFAPAQKRTKRKPLPVKQQLQSVTVEGATFQIPADWKKNPYMETLWGNRKGSSVILSLRTLTPEDILRAGGDSFEKDLEMFYESHKRGGTEDVRYLEIDGVKGVHFLNDYEGFAPGFKSMQKMSVWWVFQRMYKGQRQLGSISFSVPASDFPKRKAEIYRMIQATKFAKE